MSDARSRARPESLDGFNASASSSAWDTRSIESSPDRFLTNDRSRREPRRSAAPPRGRVSIHPLARNLGEPETRTEPRSRQIWQPRAVRTPERSQTRQAIGIQAYHGHTERFPRRVVPDSVVEGWIRSVVFDVVDPAREPQRGERDPRFRRERPGPSRARHEFELRRPSTRGADVDSGNLPERADFA